MTKYLVLRDSREKSGHGWSFIARDRCQGTVIETLPTGDYSLRGYEKLFCIERKGSTSEFVTNLIEARFEKELDRLEGFTLPFIICEFDMEDVFQFPKGSGIPKEKWSKLMMTPQFFVKRICDLQVKYKTKIIFAGRRGKEVASSLFKRVVEWYPTN